MKLLQSNVLGYAKLNCFKAMQVLGGPTQILIWGSEIAKGPTSPCIVGGGMVTLKYSFAHMTFWVDIALIVKNLDGFQAN